MKRILECVVCSMLFFGASSSHALDVNITSEVGEFTVQHGDRQIKVLRNQESDAMISPDFTKTSRPCPPFCAQPMNVGEGVLTIGEVELIAFMKNELSTGEGVLIDARTPDWHERGTIPGSVNIPFTHLNPAQGADDLTLEDSLVVLGVESVDDGWDFSKAKRIALWCNGPWCGQSPAAIRGLLSIGYPAEKILYYRGGMQVWQVFGLSVVKPNGDLMGEE